MSHSSALPKPEQRSCQNNTNSVQNCMPSFLPFRKSYFPSLKPGLHIDGWKTSLSSLHFFNDFIPFTTWDSSHPSEVPFKVNDMSRATGKIIENSSTKNETPKKIGNNLSDFHLFSWNFCHFPQKKTLKSWWKPAQKDINKPQKVEDSCVEILLKVQI